MQRHGVLEVDPDEGQLDIFLFELSFESIGKVDLHWWLQIMRFVSPFAGVISC